MNGRIDPRDPSGRNEAVIDNSSPEGQTIAFNVLPFTFIPPHDVVADLYTITVAAYALATEIVDNHVILYLGQEADKYVGDYFIPVDMGEIRDDQYQIYNQLKRLVPGAGPKNYVGGHQYTTREFSQVADKLVGHGAIVTFYTRPQNLQDIPAQYRYLYQKQWEAADKQIAVATTYFEWVKAGADR